MDIADFGDDGLDTLIVDLPASDSSEDEKAHSCDVCKYIGRDCREVERRLEAKYFAENLIHSEEWFMRRFRVSRHMFFNLIECVAAMQRIPILCVQWTARSNRAFLSHTKSPLLCPCWRMELVQTHGIRI